MTDVKDILVGSNNWTSQNRLEVWKRCAPCHVETFGFNDLDTYATCQKVLESTSSQPFQCGFLQFNEGKIDTKLPRHELLLPLSTLKGLVYFESWVYYVDGEYLLSS